MKIGSSPYDGEILEVDTKDIRSTKVKVLVEHEENSIDLAGVVLKGFSIPNRKKVIHREFSIPPNSGDSATHTFDEIDLKNVEDEIVDITLEVDEYEVDKKENIFNIPTDDRSEDFANWAKDVLEEDFNHEPDKKFVGYLASESLRKIMKHLSAEEVVYLNSRRRAEMSHQSLLSNHSIAQYSNFTEILVKDFEIKYSRPKHNKFDYQEILSLLESHERIHDLAVNKMIIRFESDDLMDFFRKYLNSVGSSRGDLAHYVEKPFYAVMSSKEYGTKRVREKIDQQNPSFYFENPSTSFKNGKQGMGWQYRTLDLEAVWSHKAFIDDKTPVIGRRGEKWTAKDFESRFINGQHENAREVGAINDRHVIQAWRNLFPTKLADFKEFKWDTEEGWQQVTREE